jgi:hypothetical protein
MIAERASPQADKLADPRVALKETVV